jgi:hypothetical protein
MPATNIVSDRPKNDTRAPTTIASFSRAADRQETSRQWTLKGLAPETVEVSRDAARRSGMKLNAWVSRALENAAGANDATSVPNDLQNQPRESNDTLQCIKAELVRLRAQSEDMQSTVNTMTSILLKLCADRI